MTNKNPFFLTKSEAFRWAWLVHFSGKLPQYASTFGIPATWVTEIEDSAQLLDQIMNLLEQLRNTTNQVVTFKDALFNQNPPNPTEQVTLKALAALPTTAFSSLPNIFSRAISVAEMILANPLATENIRIDLKLVKPTETEATEASGRQRRSVVNGAPVLRAEVAGEGIKLNVIRGKKYKGLMANVFVSRTDKADLEFLTSTNTGTVNDRATFTEGVQLVTYTYRVQMMNGDQPVGEPSEPLIVVVPRPITLRNVA